MRIVKISMCGVSCPNFVYLYDKEDNRYTFCRKLDAIVVRLFKGFLKGCPLEEMEQ